jgi:hypothetical protein
VRCVRAHQTSAEQVSERTGARAISSRARHDLECLTNTSESVANREQRVRCSVLRLVLPRESGITATSAPAKGEAVRSWLRTASGHCQDSYLFC